MSCFHARGHGIRFQTVPSKATGSDGKHGRITLVYLLIACDIF